jgi:hypothetical protein
MDFRRPLYDIKHHWSKRTTRLVTILGKRSAMKAVRDGTIRIDLGVKNLWPEWRAIFSPKWLKEDFIAGLSVACVAIPLCFAIALASGVHPEVGLISAIIGGIFCALFGGTAFSVSGPAAAMSVLMASNIEKYGLEGVLFIGFLCGLLQLLTGAVGLGNITRFVPTPVIAGVRADSALHDHHAGAAAFFPQHPGTAHGGYSSDFSGYRISTPRTAAG